MARFRYQRGDKPLEGYTIEHGLGVGGFGEVYFAISDSGREVALKSVQNYEEIELRGIRHCMNLKSPHLVTVFDVKHNARGDAFVIMEYVSGPSLRHLLQNSPDGLGTTKAAFFLREIAKGMTYLHDAGVVHRDLKPANVFYEEGYVKIGDYSLCKLISNTQNTGHTMTIGSVHYMAPEVSKGRYDSGVDVYALGVMLFEMLTGTPPFTGESIGEVLMKHLNEEPDLSQIEEPFRSVVARAMNKNPDARYGSPAEMVEAIYGTESVQNSVVAFNPQELTIVAGKVAATAQGLSGGGGHVAHPVPFESGDPSAWKNAGGDSASASVTAFHSTDSPVNTVAVADDALKSPARPASDPMPLGVRYGLGFATAVGMSLQLGMYSGFMNQHAHDKTQMILWTFCVIGLTVTMLSVVRKKFLASVSINAFSKPWVFHAIALLTLIFVFVAIYGINGQRPGPIWVTISAILPFSIFNVHRLTHADRDCRFRIFPVVVAASFAALLSLYGCWILSSWTAMVFVLPATIAAGIAAGAQIVSPWHRPIKGAA